MRRCLVLALAVGIDLAWGEPRARWHPVVWFGRLVSVLEQHAPRGTPWLELAAGTTIALAGAATAGVCGWLAQRICSAGQAQASGAAFWGFASLLLEAWLLKPTLAVRALCSAAFSVQRALEMGDLPSAREALRHLASRNASALSESQVAAAAIESVAENASDSVVAPCLAFALFGLGGAYAYRAINTMDAMLGYHGAYEWLGKVPARLDDAANLLPARLTALLLCAAGAAHGSAGRAIWIAARDHGCTESPNAGWPMSAMSGALGVRLDKVGAYALGRELRQPTAGDIERAVGLARESLGYGLAALCLLPALSVLARGRSRVLVRSCTSV